MLNCVMLIDLFSSRYDEASQCYYLHREIGELAWGIASVLFACYLIYVFVARKKERRWHREPQQTRRLSDPRKLLLPVSCGESLQTGKATVPSDTGRIPKSACYAQTRRIRQHILRAAGGGSDAGADVQQTDGDQRFQGIGAASIHPAYPTGEGTQRKNLRPSPAGYFFVRAGLIS